MRIHLFIKAALLIIFIHKLKFIIKLRLDYSITHATIINNIHINILYKKIIKRKKKIRENVVSVISVEFKV